jgi:hypothetical protein
MTPIIWLSRNPKWMYKQKERPISLSNLSVLNPPPGDWVIGVFKAYFDDSGDEKDPQETVSSLAGWVATAEQWQYFEKNWEKALKDHEVPYLHMKEFAPRIKDFKKYKDDEESRIALLQSLIRVMSEAQLEGVASVVKMVDLRYFNDRYHNDINSYAFNLHTCMNIISDRWPDTIVEMWLDRTNKLGPKINKAKDYCKSEGYYGHYNDKITPLPIPKGLTFKEVIPIQAADLLAWEIRRDVITNSFAPIPISDPPFPIDGPMFVPPSEWPNFPKPPMRKSLAEVLSLVDLNDVPVWNRVALCHLPMFITPMKMGEWYHKKLLEKAKKAENKP